MKSYSQKVYLVNGNDRLWLITETEKSVPLFDYVSKMHNARSDSLMFDNKK